MKSRTVKEEFSHKLQNKYEMLVLADALNVDEPWEKIKGMYVSTVEQIFVSEVQKKGSRCKETYGMY